METPTSPLFRSRGEFKSLYTTEDRGYYHVYHRQELLEDVTLLAQTEQWGDRDFYKDFFYPEYRNRTEPRTFANVTLTRPQYLASASVRKRTNDGIADTERLPEATFHLLERPLVSNFYGSFDAVAGYNEREPRGPEALRTVNVARLTFDWDITEALSVTPFYEIEGTWYSDGHDEDDGSNTRLSNTVGATLQTRMHRIYGGAFGFSGFKHIVVPSLTYSYRPEPTMDVEETPRFDAYDNVYGRSRLEAKVDNIVLGRDAETDEVWQVARLTLYQGSDFWNELRKSDDYEIELDLRPRQWWGFQLAGEHHSISNERNVDSPFFFQRTLLETYERLFDTRANPETARRYNARYGDYDRVLSYLYYDDRSKGGKFNARVGYAYTGTENDVFNKEVLYGAGYQIGENWGFGFEHRYDFERSELNRQEYELRRNLHCWEAALRFTGREEGWDIGIAFNLVAFPGAKVKF